jgi:hypothetical protein
MRGNKNSWFKSYLTDRKQFVEINQSGHINSKQYKYFSSCKVLKCGVSIAGLGSWTSSVFNIYK